MITQLTIKGFKTLKDVSVPLTRVSVLVGPNNCGKSNLLRALAFLAATVREGLVDATRRFGGPSEILSRSGEGVLEIAIEAKFDKTIVQYRIGSATADRPLGIEELTMLLEGVHQMVPVSLAANGSATIRLANSTFGIGGAVPGAILRTMGEQAGCPEPVRKLYAYLVGLSVADFSLDRLRAKSLPIPGVQLKSSGENLAAVLDRLHGDEPSIRKRIEREVASVAPAITGIVTPTVDSEGNKVVGVAEGDQVFKADAVSDGILLFIALSTVSLMNGGKALVCLEEPDKGIHPRRIREILEQVNRVASSGAQFILTTHSPVLLDEFRDYPESVLILDRTDAWTRVQQLSELPDVQAELRDVSLGELWYSGVLGGVPPK
jgi:predicted ATPase